MPLPKSDLDLWVDASTSWGLGLCIGDKWDAWHLLVGWAQDGRDIGWAETVAIELVVLWLVQSGWHNHYFRVNCDNTLVIPGTLLEITLFVEPPPAWKPATSPFLPYIPSVQNRTDPFSRGLTGAKYSHVVPSVILPKELCPFLEPI